MWRHLVERLCILMLFVAAGIGLVYLGIALYILNDIGFI
jgi:hypothetical protein